MIRILGRLGVTLKRSWGGELLECRERGGRTVLRKGRVTWREVSGEERLGIESARLRWGPRSVVSMRGAVPGAGLDEAAGLPSPCLNFLNPEILVVVGCGLSWLS